MKRRLTLTSAILGTVISSVCLLSELFVVGYSIYLLAEASTLVPGADGVLIPVLILGIIDLALCITTLSLNACAIKTYTISTEAFQKKRGLIISAIVFNFILAALLLIGMITGGAAALSIILDIIFIAGFVVAGILYIVDLCKEKSRLPDEVVRAAKARANQPTPVQPAQPVAQQSFNIDKYSELEKIAELHEKKVLTDEEFNKMKQEILNK